MASNERQRLRKGSTEMKYSTITTDSFVNYYLFLILICASEYLNGTPALYIVLLTFSLHVTQQAKGLG